MSTARNDDWRRDPDNQPSGDPASRDPAEDWDRVDEASWESFPASDPPAHWAGADREPRPAAVPAAAAQVPAAAAENDAHTSIEDTQVRPRPSSFLPRWARNDATRAAPARLSGRLRAWTERWRPSAESQATLAREPHARASRTSKIDDVEAARRQAERSIENGAVTAGYSLDIGHALGLLNEALATEIVCVLRYRHHQIIAKGIDFPQVAAEFAEHAEAEHRHVMAIAERIDQLGGNPDFNPATVASRAVTHYGKSSSLMEMIREDLVAERLVIEIYRRMINWFGNDDPTTRRLIEEVLADEERHANDLVSLLARIDPHETVSTNRGHV